MSQLDDYHRNEREDLLAGAFADVFGNEHYSQDTKDRVEAYAAKIFLKLYNNDRVVKVLERTKSMGNDISGRVVEIMANTIANRSSIEIYNYQ